MNKIKELLGSDKVKVIVAVTAAIVIYFTPDHIDRVVETLLLLFGIDCLVLKKNENEKQEKPDETNVINK